jgi:hypothetical protein
MAGEDVIMVRQKECKRLYVIQKVLEKAIKWEEAAQILSLSSRQIRSIVKRVRLELDKGVIHKSRGQPSNRRISYKVRGKIVQRFRSQH